MDRRTSTKKVIKSSNAPSAVGPYSQAIESKGFIFCSGQIGINPKTNLLVPGIKNQTNQVMKNLGFVLKSAGSSYDEIVKVDIFLKDINDYVVVNEIYAKFFKINPPARVTIEASNLPRNALVEISCIAQKNG